MQKSMEERLIPTCINLLKKFNRHDSDDYWPTSIKDTIQWFTFPTIMEHTTNIMGRIMG